MSRACTWDFTIPGDQNINVEKLRQLCKKWCYQKEQGESGYIHWQGRISLKVKKNAKFVKELLGPKSHVSITSNANRQNMFYVMKEETRISGPFTEKDVKVPRQLRNIELKEWQRQVVDISEIWDDRSINVIIDENGGIGKSTLALWMLVNKKGRKIPYANCYKDIMRCVMGMPKSNCYMIDLPKGIDKSKLAGMYSGIEDVKNGYVWDDRYEWKEEVFDSPNIWVFTNEMPNMNLLSRDRWVLWEVQNEILTKI